MKTTKNIAARARWISAGAVFCLIFLAGCSALPVPPVQPVVYDFGPGMEMPGMETPGANAATGAPLVLAEVQSNGLAEGSTALQYRLGYDGAQQLRAYQRARWSQPPARLVRQSVANELGRSRPVLDTRSARETARSPGAGRLLVLRLELEEFSQIFASPAQSRGVLRLRATLAETGAQGERLLGQRLVHAEVPAASQDAAGGSAALAQAARLAAQELAGWVAQTAR